LNLEDAHWADPTTLEVISRTLDRIDSIPTLVLITGRPEFTPAWSTHPNVSVVSLDRLSDAQCEGLISEIIAGDEVRREAIEQILDHSDGNPLFVEELSAAFVQSGSTGDAVPDTLHGSLMARLDHLGDAKRTAQLCSVLGRQFARPLLMRLHGSASGAVEANLSLLVANDVLHPLGQAEEGRFQFKHALLRDAAYESLLLAERRRLHERCGRQLEEGFPEVAQTEPELLAHHFRQAGMALEAAGYLERAGDRASASAAYVEAIASYRDALSETAKLQDTSGAQRELRVLLKLGPPLTIIDGAQSATVRQTYARAEKLGQSVNDLDGRFKALWGLWYNANVGRDYERAAECAEKLVALSEQSGDDAHVLEAIHCRWSSAMFRGECKKAIDDAERGSKLYRRNRHHRLAVCAYGVAGSAQVTTGQFDAALGHIAEAVALARDLNHPHSLAHALMTGLSVAATAADYHTLREWGEALAAVADTYNFPPQRAVAAFFLEWGNARKGELDLARLRSTFDTVVAIGPLTLIYVALYAEQLLAIGQTEEAFSVIDHFVGALKFPFGFYLPEIYRIRGESLAARDRPDEARLQLQRAVEKAREQGAELFALRALMLNDPWQQSGTAIIRRSVLHASLYRQFGRSRRSIECRCNQQNRPGYEREHCRHGRMFQIYKLLRGNDRSVPGLSSEIALQLLFAGVREAVDEFLAAKSDDFVEIYERVGTWL
jgi:tetratricopeptide (TPR) repeat protein